VSVFAASLGVINNILRGAVYVILCLAVLTQHRLVTDRQTDGRTDGQTQGHTIYRVSIVSRGTKLAAVCADVDVTISWLVSINSTLWFMHDCIIVGADLFETYALRIMSFPDYFLVGRLFNDSELPFVRSPPDSVSEGIMFSGCPSATFVRPSVRSFVRRDLVTAISREFLEQFR